MDFVYEYQSASLFYCVAAMLNFPPSHAHNISRWWFTELGVNMIMIKPYSVDFVQRPKLLTRDEARVRL